MYLLIKWFDKTGFAVDEKIISFHFKADGTLLAVETNKSVYGLNPQ